MPAEVLGQQSTSRGVVHVDEDMKRPKREVILIFTTAESCGATTKRQGVVSRNSPHLSALQSVRRS
jgi:hypothetical protein